MKAILIPIYIVRHGETEWNTQYRLQGHSGVGLNINGKAQAKNIADKFKDVNFDAIFSSDLLRAKETAEIIALEKELAVRTTELLRERKYGRFEGEHYQNLGELNELLRKFEKLTTNEKNKLAEAGIENSDSIISRFITFLREIAVGYAGKVILVVSHGGVMRTLLNHLGLASDLPPHAVSNGAYLKLQSDGVDFFAVEAGGIKGVNIVAHK